MHRSFIRSDSLTLCTIPVLQEAYECVLCAMEVARIEGDHKELVRLLVDRELLGEVLDQRYEKLLDEKK